MSSKRYAFTNLPKLPFLTSKGSLGRLVNGEGLAKRIFGSDGWDWKGHWLGTTSGNLITSCNWRVCVALWVELYIGESLVWCANCYLATVEQ